MSFPFENLEVYQMALDWIEQVEDICKTLHGKISKTFIDQLSRASLSISLNIAEGNGRWHKADKRQFFWVARGSVFECVPIIQVLQRKSLITDAQYQEFYDQLQSMAKMLSGLIKSVDKLDR
jgi:four helix bundle protein